MFLSAFYSLAFQIDGLIGPGGIRPAADYLAAIGRAEHGPLRLWYAPTLLWLGAGTSALHVLVVVGTLASLFLTLNVWPRAAIAVALVAFLSFVGAAQEFSEYQSDGMLLEAAFLSLFLAPGGMRPGLASDAPPSRAARFLLVWEWFRIYFESGVVKLASGDVAWRDMTAMDHYYENGPLPTWVGWYVQHLPHGFHAATTLLTLAVELVLVFFAFGPRCLRLGCFAAVSALQLSIIATANYAFLNYLVLALGVWLLDDRVFLREPSPAPRQPPHAARSQGIATLALGTVLYATSVDFLLTGAPQALAWLTWPARALEPFRIANRYGLFAVMTPARYEVELQGTLDGVTWVPYPFRYKPQALDAAPGIYAPYQPRFEWNLWFASVSTCRQNPWVPRAQARLLEADPAVLSLFASDPFHGARPLAVRSVAFQYWFTSLREKRATGAWWRRDEIGPYCGTLSRR